MGWIVSVVVFGALMVLASKLTRKREGKPAAGAAAVPPPGDGHSDGDDADGDGDGGE